MAAAFGSFPRRRASMSAHFVAMFTSPWTHGDRIAGIICPVIPKKRSLNVSGAYCDQAPVVGGTTA